MHIYRNLYFSILNSEQIYLSIHLDKFTCYFGCTTRVRNIIFLKNFKILGPLLFMRFSILVSKYWSVSIRASYPKHFQLIEEYKCQMFKVFFFISATLCALKGSEISSSSNISKYLILIKAGQSLSILSIFGLLAWHKK